MKPMKRDAGQAAIELVFMMLALVLLLGVLRSLTLFELDVFNRGNYVRYRTVDTVMREQKDVTLWTKSPAARTGPDGSAENFPPYTYWSEQLVGGPVLKRNPVPLLGMSLRQSDGTTVRQDDDSLVYNKTRAARDRTYYVQGQTYALRWDDMLMDSWRYMALYGFLNPPF